MQTVSKPFMSLTEVVFMQMVWETVAIMPMRSLKCYFHWLVKSILAWTFVAGSIGPSSKNHELYGLVTTRMNAKYCFETPFSSDCKNAS